ncbi:hypothetical protein Glove_236g106 [Diversispora epigaea]|uniref:C2H2-type domain-containing protein n=1 Tax=Diversispora epigaea TaxID=1348612 RepID=A0A397IIH4_9GLOM|nr:hypothetical protein Glove_236g106 [Diversispora epigaea]
MSTSFQCPHCPRNFSTRNVYSQHVNRCINTVYLSTEESSEDISDIVSSVNEMSLDDEDFSHINEFQIIREENSQVFYQYESDQDYAGDISFEPEVENIKEFPNEAYADLMALVIENNLNNKAGNAIIKFFNKHSDLSQLSPLPKNIETGRKFMDKMNISQLSYSKYCVLTHNSQDYFVHYRPIKNCIKNLLSNPDILKNLMFRYENSKIEDEKSYGEQNSRNWWKRAERSISNHANILSIILYSDATTTDTLGKSSLHPIYVSLGNIPTWRRNKEDAKQLLGYLPILSAKNEKEKKSSEFKELARKTFHNSIKFLLDLLFQGDGVDFNIDDKDIWFFPRISTIICDWPEACTFSLTYKSANSNYPCHFCLVQREDLIDIRKEVILRNHVNMKEYFDSNTSNLAGLEQVNNYFWSIPNLNIYAATVPDRMHHLDLGLFKYQIEFTMELLKKKKSLNKVNERIANIPRHSQLKVFKKGIQLSRLTASEYRDMMKIMVFVVDDLQIENLSEVYVKWNEMYLLSRSEKFKESDLENFQKAINDWGDLFIKLFQNISNSHLKFPKLHSWIYHIVDTIREYGAINGYTTETYESLHKTYVKIPYRLSNKKEVEKQIIENKAINDWGDLFIKLFQNISNSHLKFPKLHSWIYHIVDTIREYGAINGYTTETYESLHKTYVKIPYRLSNKKEVEKQIIENIRRRTIVSRNRVGKTKTPMAFVYTAKLFDFDLSESMIEQNKIDPNLDKKIIKGFEKFIDCLKVYLNILNIISAEGCRIKIYSSVTLKNGAILRTKNDFHHRPWFSNIAVNMNEEELSEYLSDKGICYAQTLLITEIRLPNKSPMHLALVQWYDFIEETPFVYGCPLLRLVEVYNFIEIEAIEDTIHVVPRFDKNNEYFVIGIGPVISLPKSEQRKIFENKRGKQDHIKTSTGHFLPTKLQPAPNN